MVNISCVPVSLFLFKVVAVFNNLFERKRKLSELTFLKCSMNERLQGLQKYKIGRGVLGREWGERSRTSLQPLIFLTKRSISYG